MSDRHDPDEETADDVCEALGHQDRVRHEDADGRTYTCDRCGAEWWEDPDE